MDTNTTLKNGDPIPMILVVNKFDLVENVAEEDLEEQMTQAFLDEFAENNGFIAAIRVSAKTGLNINQSFSKVVKEIFVKEI